MIVADFRYIVFSDRYWAAKILQGERRKEKNIVFLPLCRAAAYLRQSQSTARRAQKGKKHSFFAFMPSRSVSITPTGNSKGEIVPARCPISPAGVTDVRPGQRPGLTSATPLGLKTNLPADRKRREPLRPCPGLTSAIPLGLRGKIQTGKRLFAYSTCQNKAISDTFSSFFEEKRVLLSKSGGSRLTFASVFHGIRLRLVKWSSVVVKQSGFFVFLYRPCANVCKHFGNVPWVCRVFFMA